MSSAKARPENAEVERRVKRRLQRLHRKRCPPSPVVPSFVTLSELHRGHDIDMSSYAQPTRPTFLQENRRPNWRVRSGRTSMARLRIHPAFPVPCDSAPAMAGCQAQDMNGGQ